MKNVARIVAVLFLAFAGLSSQRASAIIFFCSDVCSSGQSCNRNCSDDSGFPSSCAAYGCCIGNPSGC